MFNSHYLFLSRRFELGVENYYGFFALSTCPTSDVKVVILSTIFSFKKLSMVKLRAKKRDAYIKICRRNGQTANCQKSFALIPII